MTMSAAEFVRAVSFAFPDTVQLENAALTIADAHARLRFGYSENEPRRLGALRLPSLQVQVSVLAGSTESAAALLARFDRATQRGGG
jgi:hypothetical protein